MKSKKQSDSPDDAKIWVVQVVKDSKIVGQIAIQADKSFIGRMTQNHIVLDDSAVSRSHAMISRNGDKFFIIDQGSQNGTLINGKVLLRDELRVGDLVSIGPFTLKLQKMDEKEFGSKK
jgi:pSer/pThr/pTyr-binding forkhead associated (FHA) protein